jgi:hypothetical protein
VKNASGFKNTPSGDFTVCKTLRVGFVICVGEKLLKNPYFHE